jgi:hypothetical protein
MRKTAILIAGVAIGVFLGRHIESNPETKKTLTDAGDKIKLFASAVSEGYREQEASAQKPAKAKTNK